MTTLMDLEPIGRLLNLVDNNKMEYNRLLSYPYLIDIKLLYELLSHKYHKISLI